MVLKDVFLGFRHGKFIFKTAHPVRLKQPECSCVADKHQVKPEKKVLAALFWGVTKMNSSIEGT